jgi:hypothetical protein
MKKVVKILKMLINIPLKTQKLTHNALIIYSVSAPGHALAARRTRINSLYRTNSEAGCRGQRPGEGGFGACYGQSL